MMNSSALILQAAHKIKEDIYGNRLVLFAPLYIANHCANNCLYCGFRRDNKELNRVALTMEQINKEVQVLEREGHKRLLMLCGEHPTRSSLEYFMEAIETAYATKTEKGGEIRRINVEIAPLEVDEYKQLKKTGIGTCRLVSGNLSSRNVQNHAPQRTEKRFCLAADRHAPRAGRRHQ